MLYTYIYLYLYIGQNVIINKKRLYYNYEQVNVLK